MSIICCNDRDFVPVSFRSVINNLLENSGSTQFVPNADIIEKDEAYEVHLEIPGMKKEDLIIDFQDNYLTVSGERKFKTETKKENYHSIETRYGAFSRSFTLPENINKDKIKAQYNDGILTLLMPKDHQKVQKQTLIKVE